MKRNCKLCVGKVAMCLAVYSAVLAILTSPASWAADGQLDYFLVSRDGDTTYVKSGKPKETVFESPDAKQAIEWAMSNSGITVVEEGTYTLAGSIEVPRSNVSLVITEKAELVAAPDAPLTIITEGHGRYASLIYNAGHDHVNIVNFGTLDAGGPCVIMLDGRNGGDCGIDGGLVFSSGLLRTRKDAVWMVDAKNVTAPLIWCDWPANTLVLEGCEDVAIGTVAELATEGRDSGRHGNEAIDLNSYSRRVHVKLAIGTPPLEEVIDINNSPNCVFDEVRSYGKARLVSRTVYPPTGKRLTQKTHISHSDGAVVRKETIVDKKLQSWKKQVDVRGLPETLPRITVVAKLTAAFEDGSEEEVLNRIYHLHLDEPR
jgi:hypothetical protein